MLGALGRPRFGQPLELFQPGHVACDPVAFDASAGDELVQERQKEEHVGVRPDEHVLARHLGRLGTPRIDEVDPAAAGFDLSQSLHRVGHLQEAPLRDHRIRAGHDQTLGVVEVGERLRERKAVHMSSRGKLVRAVLRRRRVRALGPEPGHEALREDRMQSAEAGRGSDVHRDRVGAELRSDAAYLGTDLLESLLPGHAFEAVTHTL